MKSRRMRLMAQLIRDNGRYYLRALVSTVCTALIGLMTPLLLAETIDAVIGTRPLSAPAFIVHAFEGLGGRAFMTEHLWVMAMLLLVLSVARSLFMYVRGRSSAQGAEQAALTLRERLYEHLQRLSYNYHVKAETGDLIQRCTSDVETTRRFLASQLIEAINAVVMVALAMVILFGKHVQLTLISTAIMLPLFLFAFLFFRQVIKNFRVSDEAEGRMSAVLQENLTGVRVVRAFGRQQYEVDKFDEKSASFRDKSDRVLWLLAVYWSASDAMILTQMCVSLLFGVVYASQGVITVGELTVFTSYIGMILWPVRNLGRILSDAGKALVSLERIDEILRRPAETDAQDAIKPDLSGDIVFDHVSFAYDGKQPVLEDVSFTAPAGKTVAILGATGVGKSTLVHLLQRLYEPGGGRITIGGHDLSRIDKHHLRSRVGLILQEPFLYSKTIRENVGIAKQGASDEQIYEAARVAQADAFIRESEMGYETPVGERGVTLSGGQKQRIAIARTLLKENDILIFDDSLSAVDTQTDAAIRRELKRIGNGTTTFIISHRITTLAEADLILVMDKGRIVQQGTHEELTRAPGLYQRIYHIQGALEEGAMADETA